MCPPPKLYAKPDTYKVCTACIHHRAPSDFPFDICTSADVTPLSPVTGKPLYVRCVDERYVPGGKCGPEGKKWKPKMRLLNNG